MQPTSWNAIIDWRWLRAKCCDSRYYKDDPRSLMPTRCPTCDGARYACRVAKRNLWQRLLLRPASTKEPCETCSGIGIVKGSPEEEREFEERKKKALDRDLAERRRQKQGLEIDRLLAKMARDHPHPSRRDLYQDALNSLGPESVCLLVEKLKTGDLYGIPSNAAMCLGWLGDNRACDPLLALLQSEGDRIPDEVICALGNLGEKRAAEHIKNLKRLYDRSKGELARSVLKQLGMVPIDEPDFFIAERWTESVIQMGSKAVPALLRRLNSNDTWYATVLGEIGDPAAVAPLMERLRYRGSDWSTVQASIRALAKIGAPQAVGLMADLLACNSDAVQFGHVACEAIYDILRTAADQVEFAVLESLANLPSPLVVYGSTDESNISVEIRTGFVIGAARRELSRRRAADS